MADWPIGWYAEPAVWQHESAAGNIAAWCTRSDGGYAVRLTTGDLTAEERALAGPAWTFALRSSGRVLIDGDYHLPGEEYSGRPPGDEAWIDLPEGLWHVTVTAIEWTASELPDDAASKRFTNYVVAFAPAGDAPAPKLAKRPPDLVCLREAIADDTLPDVNASPSPSRQVPDMSEPMPAGVSDKVVPAPGNFTSEGESNLVTSITPDARIFDAFKKPVFMAKTLEVGAIGQVCRLSGAGGAPNKPPRFSLTALAPARVTAIEGRLHEGNQVPMKKSWPFGAAPPPLGDFAAPLLSVRVEPVELDMTPPDDLPMATFRDAALRSLDGGALCEALRGKANYHRLILSQVENYPRLVTFAQTHLPMGSQERMALSALDFAARARAVFAKLG